MSATRNGNVTTDDEKKSATFNFTIDDLGSGIQTAKCFIKGPSEQEHPCTGLTNIIYNNLV